MKLQNSIMKSMSSIKKYLGIVVLSMVLFVAPVVNAQYYDDYGSSDWSYDYTDYGSIGDAGYYYSGASDYSYGYDTNSSSQYSYDTSSWNYDVSDYGSIGDAGYGCCDSTPSTDWDSYTYDNSSWNYDVADYGSIGDAGYGCCDSAPSTDWDSYTYEDSSWNYDVADYGSIGDAGYGCCDEVESTDWDTYTYVQDEPEYYYDEPYEYVEYSYNTGGYTYPVYDTVAYNYSYSYPNYPTYNTPTYTHTNPTPKHKPTCTLTIHPDDIDEDEDAQITWTSSNAHSVSITDLGAVSKNGTRSISPSNSKTYTLTAVGAGGTVSCTDTITVEEEEEDENVQCDSFTVSDSHVEEGDRVTLRWNTTDADDVSINHGIGNVIDDGSEEVTVNNDTTFTLTARNGSETDTCTVDVEVDEEDEDEDVQCDAFTVSDSHVEEGDRVTLKWRTTGADDVDINNGVGDVDEDGEERVTVDRDTTFTLTARNGSDKDTCTVKVTVDEDDRDTNETPRCELRISDTSIRSGEKVTLSWDNTRTDRMIIKDNHGKEIADSRDDKNIDEDADSVVVRPTRDTDYTLTVYNGSKSKTCKVGADVEDGITLTSTRSQDVISLTHVPYTGFEAGPVLTFIFYVAIAFWGVVIAYALVVRKKALAHAGSAHTATIVPSIMPDVAVLDVPVNLPTDTEEIPSLSDDAVHALESHAHAQSALISSDALRFIESQNGSLEEQIATLDTVITRAKAQFPKEDEWVVINKERVMSLLG